MNKKTEEKVNKLYNQYKVLLKDETELEKSWPSTKDEYYLLRKKRYELASKIGKLIKHDKIFKLTDGNYLFHNTLAFLELECINE